MSIVLDPSKNFVTIQIMYIEESDPKHGNTRYHFIESRADFNKWKEKGYLTEEEISQSKLTPELTPEEDQPGMPAKPPPPTPHDPTKIIQVLRTWWSRMTWKEQNQAFARCLKQIPEGDQIRTEMDMIAFRDIKLKTCLKKWDHKENGVDVELNESVIDNLVPEVAQELLRNFDKVTEVTEEQLKN